MSCPCCDVVVLVFSFFRSEWAPEDPEPMVVHRPVGTFDTLLVKLLSYRTPPSRTEFQGVVLFIEISRVLEVWFVENLQGRD